MGTSLRKCSYFLPGKWYFLPGNWYSCQGNGMFFGNFPSVKFHATNLTHAKGEKFRIPLAEMGVKHISPVTNCIFPWHKFPKIGKFPTGKVYLSFRPIPVCKNGNRRFQSIGKKILSLGSFCAKSILGLDREIFNKMCFMQLSLKLPQGNLILLFGMKQFNIKIMPAIFRPIL